MLTKRSSVFALVVLGLLAGSCTSPRRGNWFQTGYTGPSPTNVGQGTPVSGNASADPREALNQLDQLMRQNGHQAMGSAVRNASLPMNGVVGYQILAQPGQCYTAAAIGAASTNMTLIVSNEQGQTVGSNVDGGAHPWVVVCGQTGRLTVRLQMIGGTGEYYYVAYQGPGTSRPNLASLFGGVNAAQVARAQVDADTQSRISAIDQRMTSTGFQRLSAEVYGETLQQSQDRIFDLNLQQGVCYNFATFGGPGTRDTDLFITDTAGTELRSDRSSERDALVDFCPSQSGRYQLRSLLYSGAGPVFTVGYAQSGAQSGGGNVLAGQATSGATIDQNFRLLDADMRARGYESYGDVSRGSLQQGGEQTYPIQLEGGKCYAILGVGDNGVRDLDLVLVDGSGRPIDRDVEADARPVVRVCAATTGEYRMQVRMAAGQGNFVYSPYRWPRGTRGPFGLAGLIYVRLAEVTSLLGVEGYEPDVDAAPGQGRLTAQGQERQHQINLAAGQCYSILAVGGDGVNDLGISLSSNGRALTSDQSRTAFPSVRHCADQAGRYTLTVNAQNGAGQYFYQVFRRSGS
jgi:hypothetical protein